MMDRGKYTSTRGGAGGSRRAQDARGGWCARPGRIPARLTHGVGSDASGWRTGSGWTPDNRRANPKKTARERNDAAGFPFSDDLYQRTLAAKTEFAVAKNATWENVGESSGASPSIEFKTVRGSVPMIHFVHFSELPPSTSCTTATGRGHVPFSKERKWSDCGGAGYRA